MTKILYRLAVPALMALAVAGGALTFEATSHASPVTEIGTAAVQVRPMEVVGESSQPLQQAIAYWNGLAGHTVVEYDGVGDGSDDAYTVHVTVGTVDAGLAGLTQGNVGSSPLLVTIDPASASDWVIWAHELGHTLGIGHHDDSGYRGVMRSVPQGYKVRAADDKRFAV